MQLGYHLNYYVLVACKQVKFGVECTRAKLSPNITLTCDNNKTIYICTLFDVMVASKSQNILIPTYSSLGISKQYHIHIPNFMKKKKY